MPADYFIDVDRHIVFSKGYGVFTYEEALGYMVRLASDPQFRPDFNQIVDCRDVSKAELTGEQVRDLAMRSGFNQTSRRAFVVSSDLQFGLSRMFGTYREVMHAGGIEIFQSMDEALKWLGLPLNADPHPRYGVAKPPAHRHSA